MTDPVVLLHALGVDGESWRPVVAHLDGRVVLTPDLPGHGATPPLEPGAGLVETTAAVLAELDRAGVESFDLVGLSLGGLIAQQLAVTAADRIGHLVLVDTVQRYPDAMRTMWRQRAATARSDGMSQLVEPTVALWFTAAFRQQLGAEVGRTVHALQSIPPEGYARSCDLLAGVDTGSLAHQIGCPTMIVCGVDDAEPFRLAAATLEATIADARLAWIDGRHAAVLENPAAFAELLGNFLSGTTSMSAEPSRTGGAL